MRETQRWGVGTGRIRRANPAAVEETAPGEDASRAREEAAMFGYLVGVVIAPIDFTLTENDRLTEETIDVYWYVMGGTAATAVLFGVRELKRGMQRYTVRWRTATTR